MRRSFIVCIVVCSVVGITYCDRFNSNYLPVSKSNVEEDEASDSEATFEGPLLSVPPYTPASSIKPIYYRSSKAGTSIAEKDPSHYVPPESLSRTYLPPSSTSFSYNPDTGGKKAPHYVTSESFNHKYPPSSSHSNTGFSSNFNTIKGTSHNVPSESLSHKYLPSSHSNSGFSYDPDPDSGIDITHFIPPSESLSHNYLQKSHTNTGYSYNADSDKETSHHVPYKTLSREYLPSLSREYVPSLTHSKTDFPFNSYSDKDHSHYEPSESVRHKYRPSFHSNTDFTYNSDSDKETLHYIPSEGISRKHSNTDISYKSDSGKEAIHYVPAEKFSSEYQPRSHSNTDYFYDTDSGKELSFKGPFRAAPPYKGTSYVEHTSYDKSFLPLAPHASTFHRESKHFEPYDYKSTHIGPQSYSPNSYLVFSKSSTKNTRPTFSSTASKVSDLGKTHNQPSYSAPSYGAQLCSSPAKLTKEIYTYSAPEGEQEDSYENAEQDVADHVKQAVRVIFIKGPENKAYENAALALAKQAAQQHTAIYVLNKQPDIADLANKFEAITKTTNNHPDVHFVKYRTPEDAAHAQTAIQSEYDKLDGNTQKIEGGIAPVINFASKAPMAVTTTERPKENVYLPSLGARFRH